jgi:hypothetical protein
MDVDFQFKSALQAKILLQMVFPPRVDMASQPASNRVCLFVRVRDL